MQDKDHERIDALSRNVELLVLMHNDNEKRAEERQKLAEQRHSENEAIHAEFMLAMARLSLIAEAHDQHLDNHGRRIDRLEDR